MVGDEFNEAQPSALSPFIYEGRVHYYDRNLLTNIQYLCYQTLSQIKTTFWNKATSNLP